MLSGELLQNSNLILKSRKKMITKQQEDSMLEYSHFIGLARG